MSFALAPGLACAVRNIVGVARGAPLVAARHRHTRRFEAEKEFSSIVLCRPAIPPLGCLCSFFLLPLVLFGRFIYLLMLVALRFLLSFFLSLMLVASFATLSLSLRALFTRLLKTSVENGLDKTPAVPNRGQIAPEQS